MHDHVTACVGVVDDPPEDVARMLRRPHPHPERVGVGVELLLAVSDAGRWCSIFEHETLGWQYFRDCTPTDWIRIQELDREGRFTPTDKPTLPGYRLIAWVTNPAQMREAAD